MNYELSFLKALALTIVSESAVLFLLIKYIFKKETFNLISFILACIVPSVCTLPYLWFILPFIIKEKILYIIISELLAVIIESLILREFLKVNYLQALIISTLCNAFSYSLGIILKQYII